MTVCDRFPRACRALVAVALVAGAASTASAQGEQAPTAPSLAVVRATPDTVRRRPRAVEVSDAYAIRLRIHRYASYTMIPLFALQTVAGNTLFQADRTGAPRPGWASTLHGAGAAGLGTLFTVNTVTGLWNLADSRQVEAGRGRRLLHAGLLLASDAGFAYAGIKLANDATHSQAGREDHRRVAYISMAGALAGYGVMLFGNH